MADSREKYNYEIWIGNNESRHNAQRAVLDQLDAEIQKLHEEAAIAA